MNSKVTHSYVMENDSLQWRRFAKLKHYLRSIHIPARFQIQRVQHFQIVQFLHLLCNLGCQFLGGPIHLCMLDCQSALASIHPAK